MVFIGSHPAELDDFLIFETRLLGTFSRLVGKTHNYTIFARYWQWSLKIKNKKNLKFHVTMDLFLKNHIRLSSYCLCRQTQTVETCRDRQKISVWTVLEKISENVVIPQLCTAIWRQGIAQKVGCVLQIKHQRLASSPEAGSLMMNVW